MVYNTSMIELEIVNASPVHRNVLESAFFFAIRELMPRKQNLDVTIELCDTGEDATGWHLMEKKGIHTIEINPNQDYDDLVSCLFHECVHVRQAERGIEDDESIPYYDRPNEIEAYKLQEELLEKWKLSQHSQSDGVSTRT